LLRDSVGPGLGHSESFPEVYLVKVTSAEHMALEGTGYIAEAAVLAPTWPQWWLSGLSQWEPRELWVVSFPPFQASRGCREPGASGAWSLSGLLLEHLFISQSPSK
jgi:hypothetical protein